MNTRTSMQTSERPKDVDLVSRWSLVVLIITGLLTGAYWLIQYAARIDETRAHMTALPDNYGETLRVLLASSGATCSDVCDLAPLAAAPGTSAFRISCGAGADTDTCATTKDFTLTIEPAPLPSR